MLRRPRFRHDLHIEHLPGDAVFVLSETRLSVLSGRATEIVVPLIDGRRTVDEIVDAARPALAPLYVYYVLSGLQQRGYLVENSAVLPESECAFWSIQGIAPETAVARLAEVS